MRETKYSKCLIPSTNPEERDIIDNVDFEEGWEVWIDKETGKKYLIETYVTRDFENPKPVNESTIKIVSLAGTKEVPEDMEIGWDKVDD